MGLGQSKRYRLGFCGRSTALTLAFALLAGPAFAKNYDYSGTEINQMDAGGYASNNYYNGSGDSKDEGVRNGMRALNHLAALDIGGAIHYGYKGYGNYTNSQNMDDLDSASWKNKDTMTSLAAGPISGSSGGSGVTGDVSQPSIGPEQRGAKPAGGGGGSSGSSQAPSHKLADMDRSFLYRGETGDVAAEFEKKSGMSREEFFNQLAATEASGLSWDDPNVADKMEARYQAFVAKIPNAEYRSNIEKMHSMFSLAKKTQLLEEAAAFYKKMRSGDGSAVANNKADMTGTDASAAKIAAEAAAAASAAKAAAASAGDREPASVGAAPEASITSVPKLTKEQMGMYLGLDKGQGDDLKDLMGPEDTIFRVVSKRYRKLTPMMIGKLF